MTGRQAEAAQTTRGESDVENGTLGERVRSVAFLLETFRELVGPEAAGVDPWVERLRELQADPEDAFRVAVAGAVKSGKSTLVNALIGRDLLKRGAGIVTSLVTRVRPGPVLRAVLRLKGWEQINREAAEAVLFLGAADEAEDLDLRNPDHRRRLERILGELGERALTQNGTLDRNAALLRALLNGFPRVEAWVRDEPSVRELGPDRFAEHRAFAGEDALATYVDDLGLEVPGLDLPAGVEIGDCQGYDSPNPRHREKVQEYLLGTHLVLYVVSSRVGVREADLRFVKDLKSLGLAEGAWFVLNADLGEHESAAELEVHAARMAQELRPLTGEATRIRVVSALRGLLETCRRRGDGLERREELLLALWDESPARAADGFEAFRAEFHEAVTRALRTHAEAAAHAAVREAAAVLGARVEAALDALQEESRRLGQGGDSLRRAREQVERSLGAFEEAVRAAADRIRAEMFRQVDRVFHPSGGVLAEQVMGAVERLEPPRPEPGSADPRSLLRQMTRVYQEMRAAFHRYKVEEVNPRAVEAIRKVWQEASGRLEEQVRPPADLLIRSLETYREEARRQGVQTPAAAVPSLDPSAGRRVIPLFSAVAPGTGNSGAERALSLAAAWTRRAAAGWTRRILRREERTGFAQGLLRDGAEAARALLAEESRSALLHYNEQVKYQVLGPGLEALADGWIEAYQALVRAVVQDLNSLEQGLARKRAERQDLIPRLEGIRNALGALAA